MNRQSTTQQNSPDLRLVVTGGGTGGHVSPIVAVLEELTRRSIDYEPLWIGSRDGAERYAARSMGVPFEYVSVGKLRRYVSLHTIPDAVRVPVGIVQSVPLLRRFRPDAIFSTGGYVGVPAVVAGRALNAPTITHEQTAVLGLATKINARFSHTVALSHEQTPHPTVASGGSVVVTGNPIRSGLVGGDPQRARSYFGIESDLPLLYVTGGAQGAQAINDVVGQMLPQLLDHFEVIHQTGPNRFNGGFHELQRLRDQLPCPLASRYHLTERTGDELADIYASEPVVLGRAGAGTVAEIAAFGLPAVLVPLPGALEQRENARMLEDQGGAIVIDQENLTATALSVLLVELATCRERREAMSFALKSATGAGNAAALLVNEILRLADREHLTNPRGNTAG